MVAGMSECRRGMADATAAGWHGHFAPIGYGSGGPPPGRLTMGRPTLGRPTQARMALARMVLGRMALGRLTLGRLTLGRLTLGRLTLGRMALERRAPGCMASVLTDTDPVVHIGRVFGT